MSTDDPKMVRADSILDQNISDLVDRAKADLNGFADFMRKIQASVERGNHSAMTPMSDRDFEWLMRLAHFGGSMLTAKMLGRDV
jgi:hypothetical protein